jgi:Family of unknown function (DUF6157)
MMNYHDTFIRVAPDCPVSVAVVPTDRRGEKSIPQIEYELLAENPYTFTQEELLFAVHVGRQGIVEIDLKARRAALWEEFFGKPRACLRASMLPKRYGWGLHFDAEGRVALVATESKEYHALAEGKGVATVLTALRNRRA